MNDEEDGKDEEVTGGFCFIFFKHSRGETDSFPISDAAEFSFSSSRGALRPGERERF